MKLRSLRLRGAIGIFDGLGLDEINIDFTKFDEGTICVFGDNGSGKTTLIENLSPYRKLFTRSGGLASHFRLKDSCRDLWIDLGPDQYRFLININADSGKIESYVYRNGIVVNADGKEGSYNEEVYKLFGSPEMFAASLLMPQKRTPFSKLPPERREELFNLEGIQAKSKYAGDKAKNLATQIAEVTTTIKQLEGQISELSCIEQSIEIGKKIVSDREESLAKIEARISELNAELARLDEQAKAQVALKTELSGIEKEISSLQIERTDTEYSIERKIERLSTDIGMAKADIAMQERLLDAKELARMRELKARREVLTELLAAHVDAYGKHVQAKTELDSSKHNAAFAIAKAESALQQAANEATGARNASTLIDDVPCQQLASEVERALCSQCQFLQAAIAAKASYPVLTTKEVDARDNLATVTAMNESAVKSAEAFLSSNPFDEKQAKADKAEAAAIDAQKPAEYIQRAEVAEEKLKGLRDKLASLESQQNTLKEEKAAKVAELQAKINAKAEARAEIGARLDGSIDKLIVEVKAKITQAQTSEKLDRDQLTTARKDIEALREKLEQRFTAEFKLNHENVNLANLESDQADWTHLSQMLSRNGGFQSYLIETSAVEMTEFANDLLKGYDVPWTIEIATSTDTVDGKGKKDGFFVFVNTPTGQRELGDLSGGQAVWIDTILQHAVAFVQQRLSGKKLLTKILDESDGALDEDRAIAYLSALESAHKLSGMHHTIVISHRPEIQQMISQRIHFVRNKGIEIERD